MAIRVKYDPIGGPALAAYATGAGNARNRRRSEMLKYANEDQNRRLRTQMWLAENFVPVGGDVGTGVLPPDARGRFEGSGPATPGAPGVIPATPSGASPAAGGGGAGGGFMPRWQWEEQQRQQRNEDQRKFNQGEADLEDRRRGLGMAPAPDGVKLNPDASRRWNELEQARREILGGRNFQPDDPDSKAALAKIDEEQALIHESNKAPTPTESRNKFTYYTDASGNEVPAGTPGATQWYYNPDDNKPPVAVTQPNDSAKDAAADTQKRATWIASQANKYMAQRDKYSSYDEGGLEKKHDDPVYSQEQAWAQAEKDYERMFGAGAGAPSPGVASPPTAGGAPVGTGTVLRDDSVPPVEAAAPGSAPPPPAAPPAAPPVPAQPTDPPPQPPPLRDDAPMGESEGITQMRDTMNVYRNRYAADPQKQGMITELERYFAQYGLDDTMWPPEMQKRGQEILSQL